MQVKKMKKDWRNILVLVLLLISLGEFWIRGPLRLLHAAGWNDFMSPYIQAKAWAEGKDPYSAQVLVSLWPADNARPTWADMDAAQGALERKRGMPTPYPLTSLVLLSPFTLMHWTTAFRLWVLLTVGAVLASAVALISICNASIWQPRSQLFLAAMFALAPMHTGLAAGNPAMLSISLGVFAIAAALSGRTTWAGILLAIAVCLKPTVAIGLLLYFFARREWKITAISSALVVLVELTGIFRCLTSGLHWLSSYLADADRIFGPGSLADFTRAGAVRFNMVNGQIFFYSLFANARAANLLCWLTFFLLAAWWAFLSFRSRGSEVLVISAISILSLVPIYHRAYDAGLLVWPLAWSILLVRHSNRVLPTLILITPFFLPGPALLSDLAQTGRIPAVVSSSWWWSALVLSHEAWGLILLSLILLWFLSVDIDQLSRSSNATKGCAEVAVE